MTKPYPMEMRERAVKFVAAGESRHEVAARFGIAASTVIKWLARHAETGSAAPAQMGGYRPKKIIGQYRDWLLQRMRASDYTVQGLADELEAQGLKVDYRTVWTFVHAEGQSLKKTLHAAERQRPDVARRRAAWFRVQPRIDVSGFVCVDETWTKTNMAPLYGWSPKGERCISCVPHGHWQTQTLIAGLTPSGMIAPYVFDGPINGESFLAYVEQVLVPRLSERNTVILDNLGSHKSEAVRQAVRATGARLFFLPPYSPDLNPIEQAFAKIKHLLRKAKQRTITGVWQTIGQLLNAFSVEECQNYFINAGWSRLNS